MAKEINPEQMVEQAQSLIHDLFELQGRIRKLAWVVSTQDEDLFEALVKLADIKEKMRKYHTDLPKDQVDLEHGNRAEAHQKYWSDLCKEERRFIDKLATIGKQFRDAKEPTDES